MIRNLTKIALAAVFATSSAGAIVVTQAEHPAADSTPAAAQGYYHRASGPYHWHGRYWHHRRWHPAFYGPYHRYHAGFWVYL